MYLQRNLSAVLGLLALGLVAVQLPAIPLGRLHTSPDGLHQAAPATQACAGFYDDFASSMLEAGWSWINEDRWSLTERPGYLRVYSTHTEDDPTYLLREAPGGVGVVWSRLEVQPEANFQQAGIAVYQDENNWLRLARQLTTGQSVFYVFSRYVNGEIQVEFVSAEAAGTRDALRIRRQGGAWIAEYAPLVDGQPADWTSVGTFQAAFTDPRAGVLATVGESGESPVDFDDFCLEPPAITGTPTPTPEGLRPWVYLPTVLRSYAAGAPTVTPTVPPTPA
ncbi:MAG: DUF1349 domain-containing protein, partial [Chloroflexi bacterium]